MLYEILSITTYREASAMFGQPTYTLLVIITTSATVTTSATTTTTTTTITFLVTSI